MLNTAPMDFLSLTSVLLRYKVVIFLSAIAMTGLSVAAVSVLPQQFISEGALLVGPQRTIGGTEPSTGPVSAETDRDAAATIRDILISPGLLQNVISELDLAHAPGLRPAANLPRWITAFISGLYDRARAIVGSESGQTAEPAVQPDSDDRTAALAYLTKTLKVTASEHSNLLSIQFRAGSSALAADVVNAVMKGYLDIDASAARQQSILTRQRFVDRARNTDAQIQRENQQIEKLIQERDVAQVSGGLVAALRLSAAQSRLAAAREELTHRQAALDTARQLVDQNGTAVGSQEALASPIVQSLMQRQAELVQRLSGGSALMNSSRTRLQDELRSVHDQIVTETGKVIAELTRAAEIARINAAALQADVTQAESDSRRSSSAGILLGQLTRDVEARRESYNSLLSRADQFGLPPEQASSSRILFLAQPPLRPNKQSKLMAVSMGFFVGLFLASAVVILRNLARGRINSPRDIELVTGLPVFGSLPDLTTGVLLRIRRSAALRRQEALTETLRAIWLAMHSSAGQGNCITVVITSSEVGEGKTTVAAALARRVAADGLRVMLIDADLRRPRLLSVLGLPTSGGGLVSLLEGGLALRDALVRDPVSGMHCLLSVDGVDNPITILESQKFKTLLENLRDSYDLVILDSPPMLRVADAALLARLSQLTLFIVESGRLSRALLAEATSRLPEVSGNRILALLTRVPPKLLERRGYYSGYTMAEHSEGHRAIRAPAQAIQDDRFVK